MSYRIYEIGRSSMRGEKKSHNLISRLFYLFGPKKKKSSLTLFVIIYFVNIFIYQLLQAVSIFIDMDESGGRANEWIYK